MSHGQHFARSTGSASVPAPDPAVRHGFTGAPATKMSPLQAAPSGMFT